MKRGGFTIVELLVIMVVMVILMILAVVNLRSTQLQARDNERKSDTEAIARTFDAWYQKGVSFTTTDNSTAVALRGWYPSIGDLFTGTTPSDQTLDTGVSAAFFVDVPSGISIDPLKTTATDSIKAASNNIPTAAGVAPAPGVDYPYVYQPLMRDGTLCVAEGATCSEFNLYYRNEKDGAVVQVRSKYR